MKVFKERRSISFNTDSDCNGNHQSKAQRYRDLNSDEATAKFLLVIKIHMKKESLSVFKPSNKAYLHITSELEEKHQVDVDIEACRKKLKFLTDKFRAEKRKENSNWTHRFDLAYIRGEPNVFGENKEPDRKHLIGMEADSGAVKADDCDGIPARTLYKPLITFRKGKQCTQVSVVAIVSYIIFVRDFHSL